MKLETSDKSILFSHTEIPDVFFTEYLSQATGDAIKVYLCLVFLSKYDKDIKLFLKDCLEIEFNRVKSGTDKYFKDYDKKVEKYVE